MRAILRYTLPYCLIPRPAHLGMRLHNKWYAQNIQTLLKTQLQIKDFETLVARIPVARIQVTMMPEPKIHTFNITFQKELAAEHHWV